MSAATRWLTGAATALAFAACGGGGGDDRDKLTTPGTRAQRARPTPTATVDPADERVIRAWADTLRRGDVNKAASYFALPSLVSNGTPPIRLTTRADARFFNRTLPCGARLIETEPASHGFVIATFRLTERPGRGRCGAGAGATARAAFRIRHGKITDWFRVPDAAPEPDTES